MSEIQSNQEPLAEVPMTKPKDGSEILRTARANCSKGLTRRGFLKLAGVAGAGLASFLLFPRILPAPESQSRETFLQPKLVHGVEVYGLNDEKIESEEQIIQLWSHIDGQFARENGIYIASALPVKNAQRQRVLDPKERYLEVVVRQSTYDSFLEEEGETQTDFVECTKIHVDVMNLLYEEAEPPSEMRLVLRRVVVIDDGLVKEFYDESRFKKKPDDLEGSLFWRWIRRFKDKFPFDTDVSWAETDNLPNLLWDVSSQNGKTVFGWPPGAATYEKTYVYPEKDNVLKGRRSVIDMAKIHEWSHVAFNQPDEYVQDVHLQKGQEQRFQNFTIGTGSFIEPRVSAYLSYLTQRDIKLRRRDALGKHSRDLDFDTPLNQARIITTQVDRVGVSKIKISRVRLGSPGSRGYHDFASLSNTGRRWLPETADLESGTDEINIDSNLFWPEGNCWLVQSNFTNNSTREVYLPASAFEMSIIAGVEVPNYRIEFSGHDDPDKKTQTVDLVDETDIERYLKDKENKGDIWYAKMKVDGTKTWFVWFLRD